jgi:glycosyltransferase involved in cell wall biosynthesis
VSCCLNGRRPPQVWRATRAIERGLRSLDTLVFPSRHSLEEHRRRGIGSHVRLVHLPYFLPDGWSKGVENEPPLALERPYLAAAGRLVKMKGFQRLIPLLRYLPEVDLRIAGTGPYEGELRALASGLPNVRFEGLLGGASLARLFRSARAVVVPSLFPETFGYVVLEAFAVGTPVVVHEGGGALYETGFLSGGGLAFRTDTELLTALRRMVHDHRLHGDLAARGFAVRMGEWSETEHLERYFELLSSARSTRESSIIPRPHVLGRRTPSRTLQ